MRWHHTTFIAGSDFMAETLKTFASLLRSLVTLTLLGLVGIAGWLGYQTVNSRSVLEAELQKRAAELQERTAEVARLNDQVAAQTERIEKLDLAMRLLKRDHRLAQITVLDQWESPEKKQMTKIQFVELDDDDRPLDKPRDFTIEGDVIYLEAWIVKYLDQYVEKGDPARDVNLSVQTPVRRTPGTERGICPRYGRLAPGRLQSRRRNARVRKGNLG